MPFTNMNLNTNYMRYIRHKQASVNRWVGKQVKKIALETLKFTSVKVHV